MLGRIDLNEFLAWAESVKTANEFSGGKLTFAPKHIKRVGKLNASYAFGCDKYKGGGGS